MDIAASPRKRGRPKKESTPADPEFEANVPRRKKSTTTATKVKPASRAKKPATGVTAPQNETPSPIPTASIPSPTSRPSAIAQSKILQQVASLEKPPATSDPETDSSTNPKLAASRTSSPTQGSSSVPQPPAPPTPRLLSSTRSPPTKPAPFSPKSLNAFAVSQLSGAAHPSRPAPKISDGQLPPNYKQVARKVTGAIVAAPIAIVTSWLLWERLVLGKERKRFDKSPSEMARELVGLEAVNTKAADDATLKAEDSTIR